MSSPGRRVRHRPPRAGRGARIVPRILAALVLVAALVVTISIVTHRA